MKQHLSLFSAILIVCALAFAMNWVTAESPNPSRNVERKVMKTEEEWKKVLTPNQFYILRQHGTERALSGEYNDHKEDGTYHCAGHPETELFDSKAKFDSGTGWPSFWEPSIKENIEEHRDTSHGMVRTEVVCKVCGGHLGHVFPDGPKPTGLRYCINSEALIFKPRDAGKKDTEAKTK